MGLSLESLIGEFEFEQVMCHVDDWELRNLLEISNERFKENEKRIGRFRELLRGVGADVETTRKGEDGGEWEDPIVRRERKKAEGMRKSQLAKEAREASINIPESSVDLGFSQQNT